MDCLFRALVLFHCDNVILPSTENYSFNPHGNMRVSGVILALGNMTFHSAINRTIALYSSPYLYNVVLTV